MSLSRRRPVLWRRSLATLGRLAALGGRFLAAPEWPTAPGGRRPHTPGDARRALFAFGFALEFASGFARHFARFRGYLPGRRFAFDWRFAR